VVAWRVADVEKRLVDALGQMTKMDEKIPGDSPQKWGQYNLIGKVFSAVEREFRSASTWPVVRDEVYALAVTRNAVMMTGRKRGLTGSCYVAAHGKTEGEVLWKVELPGEPTLGGLAVDRHGRCVVALRDGSILCVGR
jgi:hypothetical protein